MMFYEFQGDFGDPLVQMRNDAIAEQIGIASWAPTPCGGENASTVYTLVSAFADWIEGRIAEDEE